ncbi:glycosyltransferase [Streptomyces sp. HNM0663]|uniref:Glycosyltransferase n=1 Tax=Streptomyces chengmaiensis TaxID=3040919 RepID=A0ABT6HVA6_9ACTN|nr:glycosyltransferase [Streptomyces chengmaiensis]MDH2392320.1 glycosyltransferase [Streptomyces chengmaiensis]
MDIGVVTTVWGPYSAYLPDWVRSVAAQTHPPAAVTILDAGAEDLAPARAALAASGLDWQIVTAPYQGMGAARNAAVAATPVPWVMHLDADDVLLPHALADTAALADRADVVAMGMWREGREHLFPQVSARQVLRGRQGCYSCAPFRRVLWQRRPWITANDWIDSAFWVGLAHLGARFAPTRRAGAVYRQHNGSYSRSMSAADRAAARSQWRRLCRGWEP